MKFVTCVDDSPHTNGTSYLRAGERYEVASETGSQYKLVGWPDHYVKTRFVPVNTLDDEASSVAALWLLSDLFRTGQITWRMKPQATILIEIPKDLAQRIVNKTVYKGDGDVVKAACEKVLEEE